MDPVPGWGVGGPDAAPATLLSPRHQLLALFSEVLFPRAHAHTTDVPVTLVIW